MGMGGQAETFVKLICNKILTKKIKNMMKSLMFLDVDYHLYSED